MKPASARTSWPLIIFPLVIFSILGIYPLPRDGEKLVVAARQASERRDFASTASLYEQAALILPAHQELWEQAGLASLSAGEPAQSVKQLEAAKMNGVLSDDGFLSLANAYRASGQTNGAIQLWEEIAARGQADKAVLQSILEASIEVVDISRAASAADRLQQLYPDQADLAYQAGLVMSLYDMKAAHASFLRAAELEKGYGSLIARMETGLATAQLEDDPAYQLTVVAQSLGAVGEWKIAQAALIKALDLRPDYADAWALLGEAKQQLGGDGGEQINQALQLDVDSFLGLSLAAVRSQRRQEWQQAIAYLEKIARIDPENIQWHIELGASYAGLGDLQTAYEHYQQAAGMDADSALVWREMAVFSITHNFQMQESGFPAARLAVQLAPEDPISLDVLAQYHITNSDYVNAEKFLTRAILADSNYPWAYVHLGKVQMLQGKAADARQSFNTVLSIDPQSLAAAQALRLLEDLPPPG